MSEPEALLDGRVMLHCGDCRDVLARLPEHSVDSVVTDPPYHLASIVKRFGGESAAAAAESHDAREQRTGVYRRASRGFMGQTWDGGDIAFRAETWAAVLRVLKPGGHLVAFSAPKNFGHLQVAVETAGFETRDCILDLIDFDPMIAAFVETLNAAQLAAFLRCIDEASFGGLLAWVFGSGFPKSHDVAKAIDKKFGIWRGRAGAIVDRSVGQVAKGMEYVRNDKGDAVTAAAAAWQGWGTALKPAFEPIVLARKPLEGTVAENVQRYGTGALNIDGCRIGDEVRRAAFTSLAPCAGNRLGAADTAAARRGTQGEPKEYVGRWPADLLHDGSGAALAAFPDAPGQQRQVGPEHGEKPAVHVYGDFGARDHFAPRGDAGSAARFFYSAKADADDRLGSRHPTIKPVALMQWLVRLVTPPRGVVLDLFAGTGTTGEAAFREGMSAILIERELEYQADIRRRMRLALAGPDERARAAIKARLGDAPADAGPLFGGGDAPSGGGADRSTGNSRTRTAGEGPDHRAGRTEAVSADE